jgi:negative regulator of sigma E activity
MEIIVLFAIVGIISSIIKNAAAKTQQPPPVVYRQPFEVTSEEPASLEGTSLESSHTERYSQESRFPASNSYASYPASYQAVSTDTDSGLLEESDALQVESLEGDQMKQHELDFSEGGLLNGIILSEILGPPKAFRK